MSMRWFGERWASRGPGEGCAKPAIGAHTAAYRILRCAMLGYAMPCCLRTIREP